MGNASAKADGGNNNNNNNNPPELELNEEEEEEEEFDDEEDMEEETDNEDQGSYHGHGEGSCSELMGVSPPQSPRGAARVPLTFTPQLPMAPLHRADEMDISGHHPWSHSPIEYDDDAYYEQGIPTMITWSFGGKEVALEGSWDNWKTRKPLEKSGKEFTIMKVLPSGVYQYRFIVDGQWRYVPDRPWTQDEAGNVYNVLDLEDYIPEDLGSIAGFEPPQSPDSSYSNLDIVKLEDYSKEPPLVPPHLQMTLLNALSTQHQSSLARPSHVVLDHLYVQKSRSGQSVVALGSTHRFRAKYVTVVLYKSLKK